MINILHIVWEDSNFVPNSWHQIQPMKLSNQHCKIFNHSKLRHWTLQLINKWIAVFLTWHLIWEITKYYKYHPTQPCLASINYLLFSTCHCIRQEWPSPMCRIQISPLNLFPFQQYLQLKIKEKQFLDFEFERTNNMVNWKKGYSLKSLIDHPSLEQYLSQKHTSKVASWNKIEDYMYFQLIWEV
jgi:hypothetical protein